MKKLNTSIRVSAALLVTAALLAGCGNVEQTSKAPAAETAQLNEWLDARFEEHLDATPMTRSFLGDKKHYDRIDDFSEEARDRQLEWRRRSVEEMKAKFDRDQLTPEGQLSWDLWEYEYETAAEVDRFRRNEHVFTHLYGPHTAFAQFLISIHKVEDPSDMEAYISRIRGVSRALMQRLDSARLNAAAGVRPPRFVYDGVITQSRALVSGVPFRGEHDNDIWADAQAKVDALVAAGRIDDAKADEYKAAVRSALLEHWGSAYQTLIAWFEQDRPNSSEIATGVSEHPNGEAYYVERLWSSTTTDMTAEEIHQLGLSQVVRIKQEMELVKNSVGFEESLQDFFRFVREDDQFYYPNTDEGRQAYIDAATAHLDFMKERLPEYFGIRPKADVIVKRVEPYREQAGAPQHYFRASRDGSRPGVFYAHLADMRAMPIPQLEVITYHEGNPGHHMQFSIAQELTDIPKFRTVLYYNVFQEGWGLYSERLAKEMGAYQDPYSDFGRLSAEIWRAIRLVLDTGIHHKRWTEEQAVQYFMENSPAAGGQIRSEVRRYFVWPGQATGYMVGMLKILELRSKAESELGDQFDIRGFHDTVLGAGQMPLHLLEQRIHAWIAEQKPD